MVSRVLSVSAFVIDRLPHELLAQLASIQRREIASPQKRPPAKRSQISKSDSLISIESEQAFLPRLSKLGRRPQRSRGRWSVRRRAEAIKHAHDRPHLPVTK